MELYVSGKLPGQDVVRWWSETWSGGGQSVAETCTSRARHVSENRDHYIIFIPMEIIHSDERHE